MLKSNINNNQEIKDRQKQGVWYSIYFSKEATDKYEYDKSIKSVVEKDNWRKTKSGNEVTNIKISTYEANHKYNLKDFYSQNNIDPEKVSSIQIKNISVAGIHERKTGTGDFYIYVNSTSNAKYDVTVNFKQEQKGEFQSQDYSLTAQELGKTFGKENSFSKTNTPNKSEPNEPERE